MENFSMPIKLRVFILKLFTTFTFCFSSIILLDGVLVQKIRFKSTLDSLDLSDSKYSFK